MNETKIDYLELGRIKPSATNPRKHFDEKYIAELCESIRAKGILQPLTVRPDWCMGKTEEEIAQVNGSAPVPAFFEIVAGECRYRGAAKVPLEQVPTIVRFLSDKETFENQLIENLQRSDLTAIEEAQGYRRLIDEMGHTVESIHEKTGKAKRTIYGALKLLRSPKFFLKAIEEGVVGKRLGELVGRIPREEMRVAAANDILKPRLTMMKATPLTYAEASDMIQQYFMRSLSGAPFPQDDATLVPIQNDEQTGERIAGGACDDCPLKTGNSPELFGDLRRTDVCTNPQCFNAKCDANFERLQVAAAAEGKKILTKTETAGMFDDDGSLFFDSPYEKLAGAPDRIEVRSDFQGKIPSWSKLLEGLESRPQTAIALDPKGRVVEMVDRQLAIEAVNLAAKQKGEKSIFDKTSKSAGGSTSASSSATSAAGSGVNSDAERRRKEEAKILFQVTLASFGALIAAIDDKGAVPGFWDELLRASITHAGHDGCWLICKAHGLDPKAKTLDGVEGAALEYGLTLPDEKLKLGYLVELLLSQRVKFSNAYTEGLKAVPSFQAFVKLYKVDLAAIEKRVRAEAKEGGKTGKREPETGKAQAAKPKKQATPKATIVNPTQQQLENAFSGGEIPRGTIRQPVLIEGKEYAVTSIAWDSNKGPEPSFNLVELIPAAEFKGATREYVDESPKQGPKGFHYGVKINYHGKAYVLGFSRDYSFAKKKLAKAKPTVAPAKTKPRRLTPAKRAKLAAAMKARWAARRKSNPPTRKAAARQGGGAKK